MGACRPPGCTIATLPTGTITFLFTDVEGSSRRWDQQRAAMERALARHDALLRAAADAHHGYVFHTAGDAFGVAFASPDDAIAAALDAQRALSAEDWSAIAPGFAPLAVRMGLHTGLAELRDGDYFGPPLNRAARLMAAGHGGQVLLSLATQQLVRDRLPAGMMLRDLGAHRLKDLRFAEHIYQLHGAGLPDVARPLATAEALPAHGRALVDADFLPPECPYRGLHAFREVDAPFFYGREAFAELLVEAVAAAPMVGVIGPSGSGKSSVVFAGLVPQLRAANGDGPVAPGWTVVEMRPGSRPYHALAGALVPWIVGADATEVDRLAETNKLAGYLRDGSVKPRDVLARMGDKHPDLGRLLLVADQFEELYTLCPDEAEHRAFQDVLFAAAFEPGGGVPITLALTLRADFMGHALAYRPFADAIQKHDVKLGPMTRDELARAIRQPAEKQGRAFESGLVERILEDVGEKAGTLPLLEFALTKLWEQQEAGWLTHEAYESSGRVEGAVARHADAVFTGMGEPAQERTRRVFVQLVQPGEGTEDTRRLATRDELGEDWPLVRQLADARLVTTSRDEAGHETAEVVHEALIRSWQRLREWMSADRRFRTWQERLRFALRQWEATGHDEGTLLRGVPLAEAEVWLSDRGTELAPGEQALVHASVDQREHLAKEERLRVQRTLSLERRGRRLLGAVATVTAVAAVVAGVLAVNATRSSERAQRLRMVATSQKLLAEGLTDQALAVAAEALDGAGNLPEAELAFSEAAYAPGAKWVAKGDGKFFALSLSPDGMRLLTGDDTTMVRLWDAASGKQIRTLEGHTGDVHAVAWLPDGRHALSGSDDRAVIVWDVDTGEILRRLEGHTSSVVAIAVSPDGKRALSGGGTALRLWDVATGARIRTLEGHGSAITAVNFASDGRRAVSAETSNTDVFIWNIESGQTVRRLRGHSGGVGDLAVSPDGRTVMGIGTNEPTVKVWDVDSGAVLRTLPGQQINPGTSLALSADGLLLASGASEPTIRLWDPQTGALKGQLAGHNSTVNGIAVSPDQATLYSVSTDATVRSWHLRSGAQVSRYRLPEGSRDFAFNMAMSPDGRQSAAAFLDSTVKVVNAINGDVVRALRMADGYAYDVAFTPDGRQLATGSSSTVQMWDAAAGTLVWRGYGHTAGIASIDVSHDGSVVSSGAGDGTIRLWESATGSPLARLTGGWDINGIAFAPDGKHLVTVSNLTDDFGHEVEIWSLPDGRLEHRLAGHSAHIRAVAVSPDSSLAATGSTDRTVRLWDVNTGRETQRIELESSVMDVKFSPDGRTLAAAMTDAGVAVWDLAQKAIVRRYPSESGGLWSLAFSANGRTLATMTNGTAGIYAWHVHPTLSELLNWTRQNRHLAEISCFDRRSFGLLRQCGSDGKQPPPPDMLTDAAVAPARAEARAGVVPTGPTLADELRARAMQASGPPSISRPSRTFRVHPDSILTVSLDATGSLLAIAGGGSITPGTRGLFPNSIAVWDVGTAILVRRFEGSPRGALGVDLSPDGRRLVSGGGDGTVVLWDVASGKAIWRHDTNATALRAVRFDSSGSRIVYGEGGMDAHAVVLEAETGQEIARSGPVINGVTDVAFSADGTRLLTGGGDFVARLWDASTGTSIATYGDGVHGHTGRVDSVAFDPGGSQVVTAGQDGLVILWDLASAQEVRRFIGHEDVVTRAVFDVSGSRIISSGRDGTIRAWDTDSGKELRRFQTPRCRDIVVSADGRYVVAGCETGEISIWPLADGESTAVASSTTAITLPSLLPPNAAAREVGIAAPGSHRGLLAPGSVDRWRLEGLAGQVIDVQIEAAQAVTDTMDARARNSAGVLDLIAELRGADGKLLADEDDQPGGAADPMLRNIALVGPGAASLDVAAVAPTAGGRYTVTVTAMPLVRPSRTLGDAFVGRPRGSQLLYAVAVSPDGRQAMAGGGPFVLADIAGDTRLPINLWDLDAGKLIQPLNVDPPSHFKRIRSIDFGPDGLTALTSADDGQVVLWDVATGREIRRFEGHWTSVRDAVLSRDGRRAASVGTDNLLILWDVATGREISRFDGLTAHLLAVAFMPITGEVIASTGNGRLILWNPEHPDEPRWLSGPTESLYDVAVDASGTTAVTVGSTGAVRVWDLAAGTIAREVASAFQTLTVAISPDGEVAAVGLFDGTISLRRIATGEEIARLLGHLDAARDVAFTPDGTRLVSAGYDGTVRVWEVAAAVGRSVRATR